MIEENQEFLGIAARQFSELVSGQVTFTPSRDH
jgi:hypothetical protein